ncbi:protein phosphatase 2C domain-containing protein, partial [Pseudomonas shirazica]
SVQGHSHRENNQPCQDAWSVEHTTNGLAACVCDGAGSARYSEIGSRYVSRLFVQRISEFGHVDYLSVEEIQPVILRTLSAIREQLVSLAN